MKQRDAQLRLQLFDLHAHGRERAVRALRRTTEAALLSDQKKDVQKLEINVLHN